MSADRAGGPQLDETLVACGDAAAFLASYLVLAITGPSVPLLAIGFVLAGDRDRVRRDRRDHRDRAPGPR